MAGASYVWLSVAFALYRRGLTFSLGAGVEPWLEFGVSTNFAFGVVCLN
jgi:hypothetical protein